MTYPIISLERALTMNKVLGSVVASAVAGLFTASVALAEGTAPAPAAAAGESKAYCSNNTCKGNSACKGHGSETCKGHNSCKGKGWIEAKDEAACKTAKGVWKKG